MVDAVINSLFLQRQHQLLRDMELSAADRDQNELTSTASDRDHSPPPHKQIKRENGLPAATTTRRSFTPETMPSSYPSLTGVPKAAVPTKLTAPVHIDIGGTIYTSSLENLTKFPDSRLARLFSGEIPIILDTMKQHYFIDRDGKSFRYILQYLRNGKLTLPDNFSEINILIEEAQYYELKELVQLLQTMRGLNECDSHKECLTVSLCPDLGERICLSGRKMTVEQLFPELSSALQDKRNSGWAADNDYFIRFPINGFCKLNSIQVLERVLNARFKILTSNGGGVEGQQFSDFLFTRSS